MGTTNQHARLSLTAAMLAAGLSLGLVAASMPAQAEPVGVPVSTFHGGAVTAWGRNVERQTEVPPGLAGKTVTAVAAGDRHSLALTNDGQVTSWGQNVQGRTTVPATLTGKTVTAIAAGWQHSLALTSDGKVTAWGLNDNQQTDVPTSLASKTVTAISAGSFHSLALTSDGKVTAWGSSGSPQSTVPTALASKTVTAIAAGWSHSLALTSDGKVTAWGSNADGQVAVPTALASKTVTAIAASAAHSLALTSDGQVTAWGSNDDGQTTVPTALASKTVTAIAAGAGHSLALASDGTLTTWGSSSGTVPAGVSSKVVTAIAAGEAHSLAIATSLRAEGTVVISGTPAVGSTLTTTAPSRYTVQPDSIGYQWYAAGAPIAGATGTTYTVTAAEAGKQLTVRVTVTLAGRPPVVITSNPVGPVVGAPTVQLTATTTSLRRGQATQLTWTSTDATAVTASDAWTGTKAASGTLQVRPAKLGTTIYTLTATGALGTATTQVRLQVTRPAKRLKVDAAASGRTGARIKVTVAGLEAGERYTIRIGKKVVAKGTVKNTKPIATRVKLAAKPGTTTIRVIGDQPDRAGSTRVRVTR